MNSNARCSWGSRAKILQPSVPWKPLGAFRLENSSYRPPTTDSMLAFGTKKLVTPSMVVQAFQASSTVAVVTVSLLMTFEELIKLSVPSSVWRRSLTSSVYAATSSLSIVTPTILQASQISRVVGSPQDRHDLSTESGMPGSARARSLVIAR